jgi:hypothetical protein
MKELSIFLFIGLIIVSYSCDDNSTDGYFSQELIPFKLNNSWESVHFLYDSLGNVLGTFNNVGTILKDTVISEMRFYSYGSSIFYYTNKNDGVWLYEFPSGGPEEHYLYFKYPCNKGDTYPFTFGRPHSVVYILSTNQSVQVEAGTFKCILYHFDLDSLDSYNDIYIAPGVGTVKAEHYESRRPGGIIYKSSEERLVSYHLN